MITQVMDDVAPEKEIRIKGSTEPWIDAEVLELIRERDRALFISNRNKSNPYLKSKYKDLRNKATKLNRAKKSIHFCTKVEEHKDNPKKLWKQFKTLGYSNKTLEKSGIVLEIDNEKCFDPLKVVSEINNYFLTVAASLVSKLPIIDKIFDVESHNFKNYYRNKGVIPKSYKIGRVSENFIQIELNKINPTKSTGIDGIKPIFLKDGAEVIKGPVMHIINLSIESGKVPELHKFAIVKPLHKKKQ